MSDVIHSNLESLILYQQARGKLIWKCRSGALYEAAGYTPQQAQRAARFFNSRWAETEIAVPAEKTPYLRISLGKEMTRPRTLDVVWLLATGEWPEDTVPGAHVVWKKPGSIAPSNLVLATSHAERFWQNPKQGVYPYTTAEGETRYHVRVSHADGSHRWSRKGFTGIRAATEARREYLEEEGLYHWQTLKEFLTGSKG